MFLFYVPVETADSDPGVRGEDHVPHTEPLHGPRPEPADLDRRQVILTLGRASDRKEKFEFQNKIFSRSDVTLTSPLL